MNVSGWGQLPRSVALSFLSSLASGVSLALLLMALPWYIQKIYGSTVIFSVYAAVTNGVMFIVTPILAWAVDRAKARNTAIGLGLGGAILQLCFLVIFWTYPIGMALILLSMCASLMRFCDQINRACVVKRYAPPELYGMGNQHLEMLRQVIPVAAGILGIPLFFLFESLTAVILIAATGFILAAITSWHMAEEPTERPASASCPSVIAYFRKSCDTWKIVTGEPYYYLSLAPYITVICILTFLPFHVNLSLESSLSILSSTVLAYGVGGSMGSYLSHKVHWLKEPRMCQAVFCFLLAMFAFFQTLIISHICLFCLALVHSSVRVHRMTRIMETVEEGHMAKVIGFFEMASTALITLGIIISGFVGQYGLSYVWLFLLCSNLGALIVLIIWAPPPKTP